MACSRKGRWLLPLGVLLLLAACSGTRPDAAEDAGPRPPSERFTTMREMLSRQPNVYVDARGQIFVRGGTEPPLIVLDETPLQGTDLDFLNPSDVDRIEVLTGAETSIYGVRGGNGVIKIYTKRGPSGR